MVEIKIEKKKPLWPWIVGVVIALVVIGYFIFTREDYKQDQNKEEAKNTEKVAIASVSQIEQYVSYVSNPKMGLDHQYSSSAIKRLVDATRATAEALNIDTDVDLSRAKAQADEITKDPQMLNHADKIKSAAQSITMALKAIQTEKFPQLASQYSDVEMAVEKINPDIATLEQKNAVNLFFSTAATLLTNIKNDYGKER